jgi:hypothetical protein
MRLHEVEKPILEVVKYGDLHCMEELGLREVAHNIWNMSKHVSCLVNMAQRVFGIGFLCVGIAELSI